MPGTTSINAINAIAIARGTSEPSNRNVLWLDENITGSFYKIIKSFNLESGTWELLSRSNLELLSDLKTVDGKGSGLDADTLHGLTPAELLGGEFSALPDLSIGQIIAGQSDTVGIAKTVGGVVTMDVDGNFAYVPNSISHTGLTDIGTNTHAQIDSKLASIDNIEGNLTNIGTLGASEDGYSIAWDNATSRFIPTAGVDSIYTADGALLGNRIIKGGGANSLSLGNNIASENLSYLKVNSIQGLEQFSSTFPFSNSGLEVTKNPGNFIGNLKSSASDYVKFQLTSDEFSVTSVLGTNNLTHISNSTLSRTIVSDTSGGTSSRLELNGSGGVSLGSTGSRGALIALDNINTFTDRNTTPKGLEYALDYSANYTDRSLVDKAFVLANAGGDSIYTADGTLTGNRVVGLDSNKLTINPTTGTATSLVGCNVSLKTPTGVKGVSNNGTNVFSVFDVNENLLWVFKDNGDAVTETGKLAIGDGSNPYGSIFSVKGKTILQAKNAGSAFFGGWTKSNGSSITAVYEDGSFLVGNYLKVGSEDISLQGQTAIKGIGTAGSSALAIYDNDTTPNKLWDFLDNGNVEINQSSSFLLSANKTLKVDGSSNTNQNIFELNGATNAFGTGAITVGAYGNLEIKGTNSTSNFKVLTMLGNDYLTLDGNGNQATLTTKAFSVGTNATTGYKLYQDAGRHEFSRLGIMGANFNLVNSQVNFWEAGMTSRKFIVGGSSLIGTEKISLQGQTAIKGIGTSGSSALAIYDNDTTPNKLWDFLDNGNIIANQNPNFKGVNASAYKLSFCRPVSATNYGTGFSMDLLNSAGNQVSYGSIFSTIVNGTSGSEYGFVSINAMKNGASTIISKFDSVDGLTINDVTSTNLFKAGNVLTVSKTDVTAKGGYIPLNVYQPVGAHNYGVSFGFTLNNSLGVKTAYGLINSIIIDPTSGSEDGELNLQVQKNGTLATKMTLKTNTVNIPNLPTSATGLVTGDLWNDGGTLKIA